VAPEFSIARRARASSEPGERTISSERHEARPVTTADDRGMCRWMAWLGQDVLLEELLFKTQHGLIDQSLHSRMGAETTNGDGFGLGWYGAGLGPGIYHSVAPAWGDANLRELAAHVESGMFLAHVRATSGTAVQETNCHPFRHGDWLFVHNGVVGGFQKIHRDLILEVDPDLFPSIRGSTDSEVLFHLALTFGLQRDPLAALEATIGLVEETARRHGLEPGIQASIGVADGKRLWAVRYASSETPRTLFASADVTSLKRLHPDNPRLQAMREGDRLVVSEPLADLSGAWHEIPENSAVIIEHSGGLEHRPFRARVAETG
jgi:predicted glutamine amidotransferase